MEVDEHAYGTVYPEENANKDDQPTKPTLYDNGGVVDKKGQTNPAYDDNEKGSSTYDNPRSNGVTQNGTHPIVHYSKTEDIEGQTNPVYIYDNTKNENTENGTSTYDNVGRSSNGHVVAPTQMASQNNNETATTTYSSLTEPGSNNNDGNKKKKGVFISPVVGVVLVVVVILLVVGVALMVHFIPDDDDTSSWCPSCPSCPSCPPPPTEDQQWETCREISERDARCLCEVPDDPRPPPTPPPEPRAEDDLRLQRNLLPISYRVELQPHIYHPNPTFLFNGSVGILMETNFTESEPLDVVTIHMNEIEVYEVVFREDDENGSEIEWERWEWDPDRLYFRLHLEEELEDGRQYHLFIRYSGFLEKPDLRGFYLTSYVNDADDTMYVAATHMQRVNARRTFPCFDEPSFKATFEMVLVRQPHYHTLANTKLVANENRTDDDGIEWIADIYEPTPIMSTYLVAVVFSDFVPTDVDVSLAADSTVGRTYDVELRVWAQPNFIHQADYAHSVSKRMLEAFEEYTQMPYELTKLDQVALPEFAPGAMENWGLALYRDTNLLYNEEYSTTSEKQNIARIIAHEVAHMWFGNTITCEWWDVTWLNEGVASYFEPHGVHWVEPNWDMDVWPIRVFQDVMVIDGSADSMSIVLPWIEHHDDTPIVFSSQTYRKGASLYRMMEYFLGYETVRLGFQRLLVEHKFGTIDNEDLYNAFEQSARDQDMITWDETKRSLEKIMETWVNQMNHPVVSVTPTEGEPETVTFVQEHFLYDPDEPLREKSIFGEYMWDIPLTYGNLVDISSSYELEWMYRNDMIEIDENSSEEDSSEETEDARGIIVTNWPTAINNSVNTNIVNVFQQAFFRVHYQQSLWDELIHQLNDDHTIFPVENRAQIIDDAFNLARAGLIPEVEALRTLEYIDAETEYIAWHPALLTRVPFITRMLHNTPNQTLFEDFLLESVTPRYDDLGWGDVGSDEHQVWYTRELVTAMACRYGYADCVQEALKRMNDIMDGDTPISQTHPDLRETMFCTAVRGSREREYLVSLYKDTSNRAFQAGDKTRILEGLACAPGALAQRNLEFAVEIRSTSLIVYMARYPENHLFIWDFLQQYWEDIPHLGINRMTIVGALTDWYSTDYELQKITDFVANNRDDDTTYDLVQQLNKVEEQNKWLHNNQRDIGEWLLSLN